MSISFYNSERYADPTAFFALRNIEREEREKQAKLRDPSYSSIREECREDERFCIEELHNAIIFQAVKDWRHAKEHLKKHPFSMEALETVRETEDFFLSGYFQTLTKLEGRDLLERLKREG